LHFPARRRWLPPLRIALSLSPLHSYSLLGDEVKETLSAAFCASVDALFFFASYGAHFGLLELQFWKFLELCLCLLGGWGELFLLLFSSLGFVEHAQRRRRNPALFFCLG
jgi:hypothetical protein